MNNINSNNNNNEKLVFMLAIKDQLFETWNYDKFIIKWSNIKTDLCRRCYSSETNRHTTGACGMITETDDCKHTHDQIASIIYQNAVETQTH